MFDDVLLIHFSFSRHKHLNCWYKSQKYLMTLHTLTARFNYEKVTEKNSHFKHKVSLRLNNNKLKYTKY